MGPVKQYTAEKVDGPLTLVIYPGGDAAFSLYEDDGDTFNYRRGEFMRIEMIWNDSRRSLKLRLANGSRMLPPLKRKIEVRVVGEKATRAITFDGRPVEVRFVVPPLGGSVR
jgi:alpha-glucosidase (family GH31 glycosyl hydrolase)